MKRTFRNVLSIIRVYENIYIYHGAMWRYSEGHLNKQYNSIHMCHNVHCIQRMMTIVIAIIILIARKLKCMRVYKCIGLGAKQS